MKRIFRSTLAAVVIAGLSSLGSCKDYLDVKPDAMYSPEDIFNGLSSATSVVLGVYDILSGDPTYGIRLNLYYPYDTDEMLSSPGASDAGRRGISRYGAIPTNSEIANPWNTLYQGIERANICIKYIPQMSQYNGSNPADQAAVRRLHGEALVLRAQFYLELIRNWGDVPAPFEPSVAGQNFNIAKTNRDEIYERLLTDLALAADLLPWRTEVAGDERVTKGTAKALRARIALYRGGFSSRDGQMVRGSNHQTYYQIARDECSQLMARRDQHTLAASYVAPWRAINELRLDNSEIIFQVGSGGGNANSDSKLGYYNGPRMNNSPRFGTSSGAVVVLPTYFYAFDSTDTRRDVTITKYTVESNDQQRSTTIRTMTDGKFRRDWRVPLLNGVAQNLGYRWPLIRFSDVLLMFAEAQNELAGPTAGHNGVTPVQALEEVRRRAFVGNTYRALPAAQVGSQSAFFTTLVRERFLEFGGEGIRKYDLIRWNLLATRIAETKDALRAMQAETGTGPYANVPQYMYTQVVNGEVRWLNSFYRPSRAVAPTPPTGGPVTRVNWRQEISAANSTSTDWIRNVAGEYQPGRGKELLPIPQMAIDTNPNLRQNFGY